MRYGIRTLLVVTVFVGGLTALISSRQESAVLRSRIQSLEASRGIPSRGDVSVQVASQLSCHPTPVTITDVAYNEPADNFSVTVQFGDAETGKPLKSSFSLHYQSKGHYIGRFDDPRFFTSVPEYENLWLSVGSSSLAAPPSK